MVSELRLHIGKLSVYSKLSVYGSSRTNKFWLSNKTPYATILFVSPAPAPALKGDN